ncbi:hypothetical protein J2T17_006978 [Paenibacillus mucilaginosus]
MRRLEVAARGMNSAIAVDSSKELGYNGNVNVTEHSILQDLYDNRVTGKTKYDLIR